MVSPIRVGTLCLIIGAQAAWRDDDTPTISVGNPAVLLSTEFMEKAGFATLRPDASLYAIRRATGYQFFVHSGPRTSLPLGGSIQSVMSGPSDGRLEITKYDAAISLQDFPCPPGFDSTPGGCLRDAPGAKYLWLNECDSSSTPGQQWNFSAQSEWTSVQSSSGTCMGGVTLYHPAHEPALCFADHPVVGRDRKKCGEMPVGPINVSGPCHAGAWSFKADGTIVSALPGPSGMVDQCLQVGPDNMTVILGQCHGGLNEVWKVGKHGSLESALMEGRCVDSAPNPLSDVTNSFGHVGLPTIGMWVSNVYDAGVDGILLFFHLEFRVCTDGMECAKPPLKGDSNPYFRFGLAHSSDGGRTFHWCGYLIEPAISFEHAIHGSKYGRPDWPPNMGLSNYIEKDGYFQIYYTDSKELEPGSATANISIPGSGGNFDQGIAVARAKISDVVAAAKQHKVVPFKKYHNGSWDEPGLAKGFNQSGGDFTPLNLPVQGFTHGDAAYIPSINQWCMVTGSGGFIQDQFDTMTKVQIAFSTDGLDWSPWQLVWTDGLFDNSTMKGNMKYVSLMALEGNDNEVLGETFAVVFQYRGPGTEAPYVFNYVNVTVKAATSLVEQLV